MTVTNYIWDDDNLLAEADGSNVVQTVYTNEPEQYGNLVSSRISGTTSYHHFDALGSTRQLTNAAGTVTDTVIYDAWGNVVSRTGATEIHVLWFGEIGCYLDVELGQVYVRARIYSPAIGRWTSLDPFPFIDGLNLYLLVANGVIQQQDPSGAFRVSTPKLECTACEKITWSHFWVVQAELADKKLPGTILQRDTITAEVTTCDKKKHLVSSDACPAATGGNVLVKAAVDAKPKAFVIWEFWFVTTDGKIAGGIAGKGLKAVPPLEAQDTITLSIGDKDSFGNYLAVQEAWFISGGKPIGGWDGWNVGDGKNITGTLPWLCDKDFQKLLKALEKAPVDFKHPDVKKTTKWDWDCCGCEPENSASATYTGADKPVTCKFS